MGAEKKKSSSAVPLWAVILAIVFAAFVACGGAYFLFRRYHPNQKGFKSMAGVTYEYDNEGVLTTKLPTSLSILIGGYKDTLKIYIDLMKEQLKSSNLSDCDENTTPDNEVIERIVKLENALLYKANQRQETTLNSIKEITNEQMNSLPGCLNKLNKVRARIE